MCKGDYHEEPLASLLFALINDRAPTTLAVHFHKPVTCDRLTYSSKALEQTIWHSHRKTNSNYYQVSGVTNDNVTINT